MVGRPAFLFVFVVCSFGYLDALCLFGYLAALCLSQFGYLAALSELCGLSCNDRGHPKILFLTMFLHVLFFFPPASCCASYWKVYGSGFDKQKNTQKDEETRLRSDRSALAQRKTQVTTNSGISTRISTPRGSVVWGFSLSAINKAKPRPFPKLNSVDYRPLSGALRSEERSKHGKQLERPRQTVGAGRANTAPFADNWRARVKCFGQWLPSRVGSAPGTTMNCVLNRVAGVDVCD